MKQYYSRILNRWGRLLFESNGIMAGWDCTYKRLQQNRETYACQTSAEGVVPHTDGETSSSSHPYLL
jgi:hypothetical protein